VGEVRRALPPPLEEGEEFREEDEHERSVSKQWQPSRFDWVGDTSLKTCYSFQREVVDQCPFANIVIALETIVAQCSQGTGGSQRIGGKVRIKHVCIKFIHRYVPVANGPFTWYAVNIEEMRATFTYKTYMDFKSVPGTSPVNYGRWRGTPGVNLDGSGIFYDDVQRNYGFGSVSQGSECLMSGIPQENAARFRCVQTHVCKDPNVIMTFPQQEGGIPGINDPPLFAVTPSGEYWTWSSAMDQLVTLKDYPVNNRTQSEGGFDMFVVGPLTEQWPHLFRIESQVCARVVYQDA